MCGKNHRVDKGSGARSAPREKDYGHSKRWDYGNLDNIEEQLKQMEQKHKEVAKQEKDCVEKLSVKKD